MQTFFWVVSLLASFLAGAVFLFGVVTATGAPQQAAAAAMALGVAVIPYVLARSWSEAEASIAVSDQMRSERRKVRAAARAAKPSNPKVKEPDVYEIE